MIEIDEPMPLLAVVKQTTEMLTATYQRQPPLQELVGNEWVQLVAKGPDIGTIHLFTLGPDREKWMDSVAAAPDAPRTPSEAFDRVLHG